MNEDLEVFLEDFGVDVESNYGFFKGILDMPDELLSDGVVLSTDYKLTAKSSDVVSLKVNDELRFEGSVYFVRLIRKIDSGAFSVIGLAKGDE